MEFLLYLILFIFVWIHIIIVLNCLTDGFKLLINDIKNCFVGIDELTLWELIIGIIVFVFVVIAFLIVILTPILNLSVFVKVCEDKKIFHKSMNILYYIFYPVIKLLTIKIKLKRT